MDKQDFKIKSHLNHSLFKKLNRIVSVHQIKSLSLSLFFLIQKDGE